MQSLYEIGKRDSFYGRITKNWIDGTCNLKISNVWGSHERRSSGLSSHPITNEITRDARVPIKRR